MEKNEIKKLLYKHKTYAFLDHVRKDGMFYIALVDPTGKDHSKEVQLDHAAEKISFLIPLGEVGEVIWEKTMEAKLLIRWLQD